MISFQRLLGREDQFFGLLEASATECVASIEALRRILSTPGERPSLEEFVRARVRDKEVTQKLEEMLIHTFVTPIEREDLEELAEKLYKIPKTVEKIGERILICPEDLQGRNFEKHLELLDQAAEAVLAMVKALRKGTDAATAREMNSRLQTIEGSADQLELDLLRDLYHGEYEAKQIIFLRDLFELLEKVIDRCRDAGNIILQIVLKYS